MVGATLRLVKNGRNKGTIQQRLENFDKSYELSFKQKFSAQKGVMSKVEMPNPNGNSKVTYITTECSLK